MEIISHLVDGFAVAGSPTNLMICLIGAFLGTIIGMLPGLGPINGVAILLPIAYAMKLPPESALILLAAVYSGCEFGGRISAILINVPGDAGAVMTTLDGYPMAKNGLAGPALSISAVASFWAPSSPPWASLPSRRSSPTGRWPSGRPNISR